MLNKALFSSNSDEWATPLEIFNELNNEFNFNLDVCATESNHKCNLFFTQKDDGLSKKWGGIESFVTLHTVILASGLKKPTTRAISLIL